jgi:nucleotide-binding universal stress UspA family protein
MKKILVPCDFSEQAINAFRLALEISTESKGEVHLLNVVELPVLHESMLMPVLTFEQALLEELRTKADKQFGKLIKKYAKENQKVISLIQFGGTSTMIINYIKDNNIDLVVMGSKGASGVKEVLVGSNAEKIVRSSPAPVLVVKKYVKASSIRNIVFPNTLRQDQEDLTMKIKALQNFFKARLHVVFVNTPGNFTRDVITRKKLNDFAKRFLLKDVTLNIYNDPFEESGVINFAHEIKADMIVMGTHGRKGVRHILSGSVAEDVVNHVDCPIWTYSIKT